MKGQLNVNIVYLAYGSQSLYDQTLFSLFTLYHHLQGDFSGVQVIIYTDNPSYFLKYESSFQITTELLTPRRLKEYKGPTGKNIHRVKTCVLKDSLDKYGSDVFYLDCDTFFLRDPRPLFSGINPDTSILNVFEYDLYDAGGWENLLWFQLRSAIRNRTFSIGDRSVQIPLTTKMWNAGVTGISYQNKQLTDDILSLTDQIYNIAPVFHVEQFAVSYILQDRTIVISTEDYIEHYWSKDTKAKFSYHFRIFLTAHEGLALPELVTKARSFIGQREILPMPQLKQESILQRLQNRLKLTLQVARDGHL